MDLNVTTQPHDQHIVVAATGEVDLHTAPRLQRELSTLLEDGAKRLIVDLTSVEFCDSTGVNVLLEAMRRAWEQNRNLYLVNPQPAVRKVLGITGLDSVLPIRDTIAEAADPADASPETGS